MEKREQLSLEYDIIFDGKSVRGACMDCKRILGEGDCPKCEERREELKQAEVIRKNKLNSLKRLKEIQEENRKVLIGYGIKSKIKRINNNDNKIIKKVKKEPYADVLQISSYSFCKNKKGE